MQQSQQEPERSITIKKPATLDSLPEDVALVIVEMVNEWVLEGKGKTFRGELMAIQWVESWYPHSDFPMSMQTIILMNFTNFVNCFLFCHQSKELHSESDRSELQKELSYLLPCSSSNPPNRYRWFTQHSKSVAEGELRTAGQITPPRIGTNWFYISPPQIAINWF